MLLQDLLKISILVSMLVVYSSCTNSEGKQEHDIKKFELSEEMLAKCTIDTAQMTDVKNEIRLFGKVAANNNKVAEINPIMSGVVKSINVGLGDYVKQGQLLATIQSSEVATFRKERLDALNNLAIAEKALQVAKDLYESKLNAEKDIKLAENEVDKAKAELERINEVYAIYGLNSGSLFQVKAPISGFIIEKNLTINEQLRSDQAEPLFIVAEINDIWAVANVHESDIAKIETGQSVIVKTLAFEDFRYEGTIEKIYNVIDPETRSMKIRVNIPNNDYKLKPEMNCTVSVHFKEPQQMVTIPSSAVIFDKSKYWVMVYKDKHTIETREIEVYRQLQDETYIKAGIREGEKIISQNGLLVYDALND